MARLLNKDPGAYDRERQRFLGELKRFHDNKGTGFRKLPCVEGQEIDLYLLYWLVTAQGGWEKVNRNDDWDDLLSSFGIDEATANGSLALKQSYLRYLEPYEKVHFLGEEEDDHNDYYDAEDSRVRNHRAAKIQGTVPSTYNYNQHNIPEHNREQYGLSLNTYKRTDYDRLTLSLTSPLPNEQDFAINVCTLLSNEGRHTLKLMKCPRLLDLLLGHAGVFNHHNLQEYLNELYKDARQYDLVGFWQDVCRDFTVKELLLDHSSPSEKSHRKSRTPKAPEASGSDRLEALMKRVQSEMGKKKDEMFSSGRNSGTHETVGQRVLQVATIIRNLSFEEDNVPVLAKNLACLRFCLLCASSEWSNLNQMGFDILSNMASDLIIEESTLDHCVKEVLLSTLTACISSDDRFQVIASLDILNKLCIRDANEEVIESVLSEQTSRVYDQLVSYLSLHDIHLLISTLECLYSLSCLGESTCNSIVRTHGAVEALVSLVTVEAQSYGPKACILMRVVETVPGASAQQQQQVQQQQQLQQLRPVQMTPSTSSAQAQPQTPQTPGQPQVVRGQLVQIQKANPGTPVQLPQTPLPPASATSTPQQQNQVRRILPQGASVASATGQQQFKIVTATTANGQPQQLIISGGQGQIALNKGLVIATTSASTTTPLQQVQSAPASQPIRSQLVQAQTAQTQPSPAAQPAQQVPKPQPAQQPAAAPQAPPQQQQVQLRVSNDEVNRQFCLSWLKATYETVNGTSIEQQVMYKQYLASLHKLGKKDVISAQHYAVCVRTLFGGSVGPNRKTMPDGSVQYHYDGIQVRKVPLPLRVPIHHQAQSQQQQQQNSPVNRTPTAVVNNSNSQASPSPTPPVSSQSQINAGPGSPILTNLLHRKADTTTSPSVDPKLNVEPIKPVKNEEVNGSSGGILDGILSKKQDIEISDQKTAAVEKSGLLASLLEKKEQVPPLVNGANAAHEPLNEYKKMNGKRPASAEPVEEIAPKKALMEANGVIPEGSSISTTAGGQKIITTPDGKQMIVKTAPNGTQVVVGTMEPVEAVEAAKPLVNGHNGNGTASNSSSPGSPSSNSTSPVTSSAAASTPSTSSSTVTTTSASGSNSSLTVTSVPKPNPNLPFLCEWQGCQLAFKTPKEVEKHAISTHCPLGSDDIPCLWHRCDAMKRKRFSLMTHLQDRHCHPQLMKLMAVRRVQMANTGKSDVPLPPAPPPHPGYAPNAAIHAIKRHAMEFVNPKAVAMGDEKEGPVTKSIRLTSSLILKNLVIYSNLGKKRLRSFESHLSTIALSNVESSRTVSQILYELSDQENN